MQAREKTNNNKFIFVIGDFQGYFNEPRSGSTFLTSASLSTFARCCQCILLCHIFVQVISILGQFVSNSLRMTYEPVLICCIYCESFTDNGCKCLTVPGNLANKVSNTGDWK